jgi:GT2 family glycosyltransferase
MGLNDANSGICVPGKDANRKIGGPRVTVVIVVWNGRDDTLECLASFRADEYSNREIVVVDNGSSDDSVAAIRAGFPEVVILQTGKNLGFTGGNNVGIRYAIENGADYVYLINNDTLVESDALKKLVEAAEANPDAGLLAPVIHDFDPPQAIWFSGSLMDLRRGAAWHDNTRQPSREEMPYEVPWITGCAMLIRAGLLRRLGGFDDRYYLSWEDVDLSLRVRNEGQRLLVVPGARIYHKGGQSGKNLNGIYGYYAVRNSLLLASKHSGRDYRRAALTIVGTHLRSCMRPSSVQARRLRLIWDGLWDHLRQRYGPYDAFHGSSGGKRSGEPAAAPLTSTPTENQTVKI